MIYRLKHLVHSNQHRERFGYLRELLKNQQLEPQVLRERQLAAFLRMVDFARTHTDFYGKKYQHPGAATDVGFDPARVPVLHKSEVLAQRESMVDRRLDKAQLSTGSTGGSTGRSLSFYYDSHKIELMRAGMCRSYMWSGWRPGQKILNFWGARQDIKGLDNLAKSLKDYIAAEKTIAAYEYTQAQLGQWARSIQRYRPVLLQGYASILAELARYIVDQDLSMPGSLKGVYSTAEVLYPWQRECMEQAFGCKVFNQYGSREVPNMACECRHGNIHVLTDMVRMESVPVAGEDRLLVTSLTNRVMPFIRYEIGDSGRLKEGVCSCGSPFPMMEMGLCRSNDIVRTSDGRHLYPSYFIHLLDGLETVTRYQFVQTTPERLALNVCAHPRLSADLCSELCAKVRRDTDDSLSLEINHVDSIARTVSGKHRFVINQVTE